MRRVIPVLAVAAVATTVAGASAAAEPGAPKATQVVTLSVARSYDASRRATAFGFSGAVSSRRAGEYVAVLLEKCGQSFSTAVAGTTTQAGGKWAAAPATPLYAGSGTYQARWRSEVSKPVRLRPPVDVQATTFTGGEVDVVVTTFEVAQSLAGRVVVLQRLQGGGWTDVQRARLARNPQPDYWASFVATFRYSGRGATLRVFVPKKTAAPCFRRSSSTKWTS